MFKDDNIMDEMEYSGRNADDIRTSSENAEGCIGKLFSGIFWTFIILFELAVAAVLSIILFTGIPEKLYTDLYITEDISEVPEYVYFPVADKKKYTDTIHTHASGLSFCLPQTGVSPDISVDEFDNTMILYNSPELHYMIDVESPTYSPIAEYDANWRQEIIHRKPETGLSEQFRGVIENFIDDPMEDPFGDLEAEDLLVCSLTQYGADSFAQSKGLPKIESYFDLINTVYNTTLDDWQLLDAERAKAYMIFAFEKYGLDIPDYYFENSNVKGFVEEYGEEIYDGYYRYSSWVTVYPTENQDLEYSIRIKTDDLETMNCILDGIGKV